MTTAIYWGPEKPYTGNGECPADARRVPCLLRKDDGTWTKQGVWGQHLWWMGITSYRVPIATSSEADLLRAELDAQRKITAGLVGALEKAAARISWYSGNLSTEPERGQAYAWAQEARAEIAKAKDAQNG